MEQFKRVQVVMLPTEQLSKIYYNLNDRVLQCCTTDKKSTALKSNQHLYFLSDDKIEEGDWTLDKNNYPTIFAHDFRADHTQEEINKLRPIVATTNSKLLVFESDLKDCGMFPEDAKSGFKSLPQPSEQFIEKYVEIYNAGKIIIDVLVEYEVDKVTMACTCTDAITSSDCPNSYYDGIDNCCRKRFPNGEYWNKTVKLKVNPKDNTITIKRLKDSWNRE